MLTRSNCVGTDSNIFGDDRMYNWRALLFHLPRALMSQSGKPAAAAVVVAPL